MMNDYIGECSCFFCGHPAKLLPNDDDYSFVECPNCGQYKLTGPAEAFKSYERDTRFIIAGEVFDSYYYQNKVKMVKSDDFETKKTVSTLEKLYRLAKFINIESKNSTGKDIPCRPAACYTDIDGWLELLDELKKRDIIDFTEFSDPPIYQQRRRMIKNIKMTMQGSIAFEKGIDSPEEFEKVFMGTDRNGVTLNGDLIQMGDKSQLVKASGHATVTAAQNNASTIGELQTLLDRLLQTVPQNTPKETTEQIRESIETIQVEMQSLAPKKSMIKTILAGLGGVVRTAEFAAALAALAQFFGG